MKEAWIFLKANPRMLDSEGQTVPPAVMNYANLDLLMDPVGHGFYGDGDREHGVSREMEALREGNHPDFFNDERYLQRKVLDSKRRSAKDHVSEQMKDNPDYNDEPRQSIQRMPR